MAVTITNPLALTYAGTAYSLPRINQDNYGSEYYLAQTTQSIRVRIRHSKESPQANGVAYDRHNIELTYTLYATETDPEKVVQSYFVLRNVPAASIPVDCSYSTIALASLLTTDNGAALYGWQN